MSRRRERPCPCGLGPPYAQCCGPFHAGAAEPPTPERLMRSRYSAFALGEAGWLLASWHSSTRPGAVELDPGLRWTGLEVLEASGGTVLQPDGVVAFRARWQERGQRGVLEERSRFRREDGAWRYLGPEERPEERPE